MTQPVFFLTHQISDMIADGGIASDVPIVDGQIQPASLDLRLGSTAYRVRASFLAGLGQTVPQRLLIFRCTRLNSTVAPFWKRAAFTLSH